MCGDFDYYTGFCRTCHDYIRYNLNNVTGICDRKIVICTDRQYKVNEICYNASALCGRFDVTNGKCLDCISNLEKPDIDGICKPIVLNC